MIRLLLVDDQPAVLKGLRMLLGAEPDLCVVGATPPGAAALELMAALHPDVVLLDLDMPRLDGIAAASALHLAYPHTAVSLISLQDDARTRAIAADAGAAALVAKSVPAHALLTSIRQVAQTYSDR